jgi:hypothetical protein
MLAHQKKQAAMRRRRQRELFQIPLPLKITPLITRAKSAKPSVADGLKHV